tara:strand:- start:785 stop:928 length:144 start_codon:yes stop_codon:yes gene_type:complete
MEGRKEEEAEEEWEEELLVPEKEVKVDEAQQDHKIPDRMMAFLSGKI